MALDRSPLRDCLRLYLVTDPGLCAPAELPFRVRAAVAGGVSVVQLRDKGATKAERMATARALRDALAGTGVPLIVNDDVDAALWAGADGVHIGQGDGDPAEVRRRIGPDRLLGLSCENIAQVRAVPSGSADHLGLGPVFGTATKPGHAAPTGLDGLRAMVAATSLPTVAIGGLKPEHAANVRQAGSDGMAVMSAILADSDPRAAAARLMSAWKKDEP